MPFQPVNFASIAPIGHPALRDLAQSLSSGMQVANLPAHLKRQAQSEELANQLKSLQAQYMPQNMQSQIALRQAQAGAAQQGAAQKQMLTDMLRQQLGGGSPGGIEGGSAPGTPGAGADLRKAIMRKLMGLPQETPSEMQERQMGTFQQQQEFKAGHDTPGEQSKKQGMSTAIEGIMPILDELSEMELPNTMTGAIFEPNVNADYQSTLAAAKDKILLATGLRPTKEGIKTAEDMVRRYHNEEKGHYRRRIKRKMAELKKQHRLFTGKEFPTVSRGTSPSSIRENLIPVRSSTGKIYMVPREALASQQTQGR